MLFCLTYWTENENLAKRAGKIVSKIAVVADISVNIAKRSKLAMENALKCIHLGCTSGILDATILKFHLSSQNTLHKYHSYKFPNDPPPLRVTLNSHNIHKVVHAIVEAYRKYDQSTTNAYRQF